MVARMTGPDRVSAWTLAQEVGLPESTLGRWLARARREGRVAGRFNEETESEMGSKERPHERSAEEKLRLLRESEGLSEAELGEFLNSSKPSVKAVARTVMEKVANASRARVLARCGASDPIMAGFS